MKVKYNKWYKCEKGTMPEDFDNMLDGKTFSGKPCAKEVVVYRSVGVLSIDHRVADCNTDWRWSYPNFHNIAWMLPEPYKE